jgi:gluconate 5-dehydrogenase
MNIFSLKGKRALVTGGGTGIGLGISKAFIEAGAEVVITGRREEVLQDAFKELGENVRYRVFDITCKKEIPAFIQDLETQFGGIDILVNNAGIHLKSFQMKQPMKNLKVSFRPICCPFFPYSRMCQIHGTTQKWSHLVYWLNGRNIWHRPCFCLRNFKAALTGLMQNLVTEYSKDLIRVNTIAPGWIESPMFLNAINADLARKEKITNRIAMPSYGTPADIGHTAVFLASDAARYITGVVLPVDGGASVNF